MPSLKNIFHKDDQQKQPQPQSPSFSTPPPSGITLIRTDTLGQEVITPPVYPDHDSNSRPRISRLDLDPPQSPTRRSFQLFNRSSRSGSVSGPLSIPVSSQFPQPRHEHRLSNLLHREHRRTGSRDGSSTNIPADLPQIGDDDGVDKQEREALWEKRATALVQHNQQAGNYALSSPIHSDADLSLQVRSPAISRHSSHSSLADKETDIDIQEAIRLHESGELEQSTRIFGQLADPNGANNPLSQVLYGLALRHGWGCIKDEAQAITYLSAAASNSAAVESEALRAGMKKGGAAKGELVLALFELANCFRNGWGIDKDPAAARQYYETAANLGDTDAMNEVAWCYLEGFGGKKDKFKAAKYYRLSEESGCPMVGNSWIWKAKYNSH
ncbi:hypothetical protein N7495_004706 [Penicillium taxi]|uniref:uncharacterized protein n=1 Tax=Penicillium taxi TaxID=168475 RepID=UPI002545AE86|nr:uncharacterized protein N7495_004706 [Penicillium taxi]KAJ5899962.1 hypothetical protein N7495_004706 [Penicillium taxi]